MQERTIAAFSLILLLILLAIAKIHFQASSWSNGGYSSDPSNPDYGTHDWIAHHALDWLPDLEKQFILNHLAAYLYGTELPDRPTNQGGFGDSLQHHVYYHNDGSLQDDASAVKAQTRYDAAVSYFKNGDLANASKMLGAVTHYIADMAVFGHVMGAGTDWGAEDETIHSDYEEEVNKGTNSYYDDFNAYLAFDGLLSNISAYDAALTLAYNTTFGDNGEFTCVWMNQSYDWDNPLFVNRCGESINLAVNLVADVLHSFSLEMVDVAHFIPVPFYYQDTDYYCGPACLAMVFDYYGENISQNEIADAARTLPYVTYTDEMVRAAHFSNISTSKGTEMPENITGYTLRKLGYAAFENQEMSLAQLKGYIDEDKPLILLMWYSGYHHSTHYRVAVGYNETHVFLHDPWNNITWGGAYGGPNMALNYTAFIDRWAYWDNWTLYVSPWDIKVSAPAYIKPQIPFQINVTITYPQPLPNAFSDYPASHCNATITLPANLTIAQGETLKKTLGMGSLQSGEIATVTWTLIADCAGIYAVSIEAEGLVSGSVYTYPAYDYSDRIGAVVNFTIPLSEDNNAPLITNLSKEPADNILPNQPVKVSACIIDAESGVKNATLYYSLNNSETWTPISMDYNLTLHLYNATIPGQSEGTYVKFKIVAYDKMENNATIDGTDVSAYTVVPEFSLGIMLPIFIVLTMLAIAYVTKRVKMNEARPIC